MWIHWNTGVLGLRSLKNRSRVVVDANGRWQDFVGIHRIHLEPRGTVRVGTDEGGLFYDHQMKEYVMVTEAGAQKLNQRKVRAALNAPVDKLT